MSKNEIEQALAVLRAFNEKVEKLERTRFAKRFENELPEVLVKFEDLNITDLGNGEVNLFGTVNSWIPNYEEEEIDAFVLTYRMLVQNNDRLSIANVARIYKMGWMPPEATANFEEARYALNNYLDSAAAMEFGGGQISIRFVVDVMLYGGLAHSNEKLSLVFNAWQNNPAVSGFMWVEFQAAMMKAMYIFNYVKRLNEVVIEEFQNFEGASHV